MFLICPHSFQRKLTLETIGGDIGIDASKLITTSIKAYKWAIVK